MINSIYFFASKKDLGNIFGAIEKEFDIKYCANYVYAEAENDEKPNIEFNAIEEIADNSWELYYIVHKTQDMHTICQVLQDEKRVRYITECNDHHCLTFRTKYKNPNGYEGDYEVYIPRKYETEFTGALFKRIVREVKRNCVRIKHISPFYVGKEMYKNIGDYVFYGQCFRFECIVTETDTAKRWWRNPNVRAFMDQTMSEHLQFLQDIFSNKELQDLDFHNPTEQYEIYEGVLYKLSLNEDLSIIKDIVTLFNDNVNIASPLYVTKSIMEELRDIELELAFSQKADGIRKLLENLKNVPDTGYICGNKEVIKTLLKKRYYETFKESLSNVTDETKKIIRNTIKDIPDKRLQKQVNEISDLLEQ